jgi:hypothetical protein
VARASSDCVDVRREALQTLARVSRSGRWQKAIASSPAALESLRRSLLASDTELVRCSTGIISELCSSEAGRSATLRARALEPVLSLLQSPVPQIARQAADTLVGLSQTHCCRLQLSQRHVRMIEWCQDAPDPRLRELVTTAVRRMRRYGALAFSPSYTNVCEDHVALSV